MSESADAVIQQSPQLAAPQPPTGLVATELPDKRIRLTWQRSSNAVQYRIYRSLVQGSYQPADHIFTFNVTSPFLDLLYTDGPFGAGLRTYYYVVTAVNAVGEESGFSNEVSGLPHYAIAWAGTILPYNFTYTLGDPTLFRLIYGEIFIWNRTGVDGPEPDVWAQFGFGPAGIDPSSELVDLTQWTNWQDAEYSGLGIWSSANSRYQISFLPEIPGRYYYTYRFSTTNGRNWVYPDTNSIVPDPTRVVGSSLGLMVINSNPADTQPPDPPVLSITDITETTVSLAWTASPSPDIYAYDVYRSSSPAELGQPVKGGRLLASAPREFTDTGLIANTSYYYRIVALDASFNAAHSNQVEARTLASPVTFTLNVTIPANTPGTVYINRAYDSLHHQFGDLDWTGIPLNCDFPARLCTVELTIQENAVLTFNFSRGSEATIQTQFDGNGPAIDPSFAVEKGMTVVNRIIANWDDPLVTAYSPQGSGNSPYTGISVTWNQAMPPGTTFTVLDLGSDGLGPEVEVPGDFSYDQVNRILVFRPTLHLNPNWHYQVVVKDMPDLKEPPVYQQVETVWNFTTGNFLIYLPLVAR